METKYPDWSGYCDISMFSTIGMKTDQPALTPDGNPTAVSINDLIASAHAQ